jgi:hypothetical protein
MTIVVSIKVTDGVVLASDSATTFMDRDGLPVKVYNNANKVFNLIKKCPIGAMTFGSGSIGTASIATLSKDLRKHLSDTNSTYFLDHQGPYTVLDIAKRAQNFFRDRFNEAYPDGVESYFMGYRVIGYSSTGSLPEGYEIQLKDGADLEPYNLYEGDSFGPRWAGDHEALDRLILGYGQQLLPALRSAGLEPENEASLMSHINAKLHRHLYMPAMPIQDAIDLARFLAETAARFSHFSMNAATIGGPIEIATITKHEGFKWVSRKHYFSDDLNPGGNYV